MIHRTATTEEWSALVAKIRETNPRVADDLEAGASFTKDGVRLYPPLKYLPKEVPLRRLPLIERSPSERSRHQSKEPLS